MSDAFLAHAPKSPPSRIVSASRAARCLQSTLCRREQRGVALVVALILLVVITLVGLAAVSGTIMQQKMSSNFRDRQIAFQVGEAGLRQAQIAVQAIATPIAPTALPATVRNCSPASGNVCVANPFSSSAASSFIQTVPVASFDKGSVAAAQPRFVIEYMGNFKAPPPTVQQLSGCSGYAPCGLINNADYYRITVSSGPTVAGTDRAIVTLQSMFRR
ncbi:type IV pilus assembly protein PilX [Rhodanobacter sp. TND4EL1]